MRHFLKIAILAGGLAGSAAPALAMPVAQLPLGDPSVTATDVALYCNRRGECIRAPRSGYVLRGPGFVDRSPRGYGCGPARHWNGNRCVPNGFRPGVTIRVR